MARKNPGPDPHAVGLLQLGGAYARGVTRTLPQVLANPRLPRPLLRRLVERRRSQIVQHAARSVPHYRNQFRMAGLDERRLADPDAFASIPFLEKRHVKDETEALIWPEVDRSRLLERKSSGSTGSPVRAYFDPIAELPRRVQELRFLTAHGFRPWYKQMILDAPAHLAPSSFLPQKLGIWRREPYPWWLSPDAALGEIERTKPDGFHGVLAGIRMLSLAVERAGGLSYRPYRIFTKGELLDAGTRWFIENTLQAKVVDFYATEETGIIAWECPEGGGYHLDDDFVWVEVVRSDGTPADPGEVGELVLTNLYQRAMPIIRYRVGDLGAISDEPCACGRSLRKLSSLRGRKLDFLVSTDGTLRDPFRVMAVMERVDHVRWFRIVQKAPELTHVMIGWESGAAAGDVERSRERIVAELKQLLGAAMRIELEEAREFQVEIGEKAPLVKGLPGQELEKLAERGYKLSF